MEDREVLQAGRLKGDIRRITSVDGVLFWGTLTDDTARKQC